MRFQKDAFLDGEGDAYFTRNAGKPKSTHDPIADALIDLKQIPTAVAEIGCGEGHRLSNICGRFQAQGWGFDPSSAAIAKASADNPNLTFSVGSADKIDLPDGSLDVLLYGFCLYLVDPADYYRVAAEADRVVKPGGFIAILDFNTPFAYKRRYHHRSGLYSHKMDFSTMFTWNPAYRLVHRVLQPSQDGSLRPDDVVTIDFIHKDTMTSHPIEPSYLDPGFQGH